MEHTSLTKTFHIIYGWAEGRWHAKDLVKALKKAGFKESSKDRATVIIAHSAGSFFVPKGSENQISVIIGFPVWPGKSLILSSWQKLWLDATTTPPLFFLKKTGWNVFYLLIHPLLTLKEWGALNQPDPFGVVPDTAIMVRNDDETFCTPNIASEVSNQIIALPGQHDDLWTNPHPYVKIAQDVHESIFH